jgi:hypothetical protein
MNEIEQLKEEIKMCEDCIKDFPQVKTFRDTKKDLQNKLDKLLSAEVKK